MNGLQRKAARRSHNGDQRGITLVELLIGMSIMTVISAMVLMGWFSLSKSYSFSVNNADARDSAREAIARVQREVRDAQKPPSGYPTGSTSASDAIIYRARPYSIAFSTTFNQVGNGVMAWATPTPSATTGVASQSPPRLVIYRLYTDGELWRFEDISAPGTAGYGTISGITNDTTLNSSDPTDWPLTEQVSGEGARLILTNCVNWTSNGHTPLFDYNYYGDNGVLGHKNELTGDDRYNIIAVQIRILVDLNPAKAPIYADLRSTAQLRNAR